MQPQANDPFSSPYPSRCAVLFLCGTFDSYEITKYPHSERVFEGKSRGAFKYLHELANLGADRLVVVVGALDEDAVAQLCSPSTSRAKDLNNS